MAGNRAIYDRAMEQNRELARQNRWDDALKGAVRALQEFPQDIDARTAAAVALFHTGKLDKALHILKELHASDTNNPFFLEYIAKTHEGQGHIDAAVASYQQLIDVHQKRRAVARIISTLREILRLRPDLDDQRKRLADLLQETNATAEAATEHLTLARRHRDKNEFDKAAASAEIALRLDPQSREAKELLAMLHEAMARAAGVEPTESPDSEAGYSGPTLRSTGSTGLRSQQFALEKVVAHAIELQEAGNVEEALKEYERAIEAGIDRADVLYSVGLIYQEQGNIPAAIKLLSKAAKDPEYALSAHYTLGSCYRDQNQLPQAAQEFEQAIHLVDLETIGKTEAEDLIEMYESVVEIHQHLGNHAQAASLYTTLAGFLQSKRWGKERATEYRRRAKEMTQHSMLAKMRSFGTGILTSPAEVVAKPPPQQQEAMPETWGKIRPITDFLRDGTHETTDELGMPVEPLPPADPLADIELLPPPEEPLDAKPITPLDTEGLDEHVKRWVVASERYLEQGLLEAALDACHEVLRLNVDYLPIHLRKGEIYERQHRPKEALNKYQILIDTFSVRDQHEQAIQVYYRAIDLSPDVTNMRSNLAGLLHKVGRTEEAADQLAMVASSYFRMGQTNKALEEYRRVLQWAPRNKILHSEYGMTLFKLERYEAALGEFQRALDIDSEDIRTIAHINMSLAVLGEQPATIWNSLATLLEKIKAQPQESTMVQAEYQAALMVADLPILHYILAIIQQRSNQHSSALFELEQALHLLEEEEVSLLPKVLVHQAMADSHIALGQAEQALAQLRIGQELAKQTQLDPAVKHSFAVPLTQGDLVRRMAEAYAATDDLEGAEKALVEARRLLPYDRAIYTKLADVYFRQGKLNEAITQLVDLADHYESNQYLDHALETLQDALKLAPNNISISSKLARLYIRRGYPDKGVEGLKRVAELQRKAGQIKDALASLQQVAEILWMQGKQEEVRAVYDKIVQIAPNDIEARQWLAIMHTLAFRTKEAIAEKKEIVRIFTEQRDYENAIAELHQIIGLDQKDIEAYYLLGDMLMRRGEYRQTAQLYKRMLKMSGEGLEIERVEALLSAANRMLEQQESNA